MASNHLIVHFLIISKIGYCFLCLFIIHYFCEMCLYLLCISFCFGGVGDGTQVLARQALHHCATSPVPTHFLFYYLSFSSIYMFRILILCLGHVCYSFSLTLSLFNLKNSKI